MARPKSKQALQQLSDSNFEKLLALAKDITKQNNDFVFPKGYLNRNIKDVLAHLHAWHLMMLEWYQEGMQGRKPAMPKKGYTWKMLPDLNREIWKTYKEEAYETILEKFKDSHNSVSRLIDKHSDEELFTKKKYKWTGTTSLGAYLISSTSSHYDWAYKLIKKCLKQSIK